MCSGRMGSGGGDPGHGESGRSATQRGQGEHPKSRRGYIQAANGGQVNVGPGATELSGRPCTAGATLSAASAIGVFSGGQFTGGSASAALIGLDGNAQLTGAGVCSGGGVRVTPATANLGGRCSTPARGSALDLAGGLIQAASGGQVNVDPGATNSLITLRGGNHTLGASAIGISSGGQFTGGVRAPP